MKNKSKLQKIKQKKVSMPSVPAEWLYLVQEEIPLREIYEIFKDDAACNAECWQEAGVLEIAVPEHGSVDVEEFEEIDEDLRLYMEEHHLKSVFAVTIVPEHYENARQMMDKILAKKGGYFCGDTDDFLPEVRLG